MKAREGALKRVEGDGDRNVGENPTASSHFFYIRRTKMPKNKEKELELFALVDDACEALLEACKNQGPEALFTLDATYVTDLVRKLYTATNYRSRYVAKKTAEAEAEVDRFMEGEPLTEEALAGLTELATEDKDVAQQ
jgi:hypothetical protein